MFDLITIGDSTIDNIIIIDDGKAKLQCDLKKDHCLLCLNYADKIPISHTAQSVGGNATNVAVGCRKMGLNTAIVTELGDDLNGYVIKHELEQARVNPKFVKINKGKETRNSVILNFKAERTILSSRVQYKYSWPKIDKTKWIYYSSLGKGFEKVQTGLKKYLSKNLNVKLAINPGSYQMKYGLKKIKEILPLVDLIFLNKQEAEKIVGRKKDIKSLCRSLHNKKIQTAVITDGTKGSYASDGEDIYFMKSFPIPAKARTGAGDAYASGFLSAFIVNENVEDAMKRGTANAGGVIQEVGAQKGLLNKKQSNKIIQKYKRIRPKKI